MKEYYAPYKKQMLLTDLYRVTQKQCTSVVERQSNHICEQCDAYLRGQTSYLTAKRMMTKYKNELYI